MQAIDDNINGIEIGEFVVRVVAVIELDGALLPIMFGKPRGGQFEIAG